MARGRRAAALLELPVRLNGIHLGRPVDVLVDPGAMRAAGFEVRCADERVRFLPLPAATITDDEIAVASPLLLLDHDRFYRDRGAMLATLRGTTVQRGRRLVGTLLDVVIDTDGTIVELVLDGTRGAHTVGVEDGIRVRAAAGSRRAP